jgi:hypothetical protein
MSDDRGMVQRCGGAVVFAVLVACGDPPPDTVPLDAAVDARIDAMRSLECAREGMSSVTGSGPAGALDGSHVYAQVVTGFCPDTLYLIVTADDPLMYPFLDGTGEIAMPAPANSVSGAAEWSGTFPAMVSLLGDKAVARGTVQVDQATGGFVQPTRVRATVRFDDGAWHFTATIDAPYCTANVCI